MEQPQQSYQKQNEQPQLAHSHNALKPFLGRCMSKHIPIGAQLHQAQIPPLLTIQTFNQNKEFVLNSIQQYQKRAQFKRSKVDIKKLQDYLLFVEDYFQEKDPESIPLGILSKERTHTKALEFLHEMNYNFIQAKFFLVFPYYLSYNNYKSNNKIVISDQQMSAKIKQYIESLKNSKSKDLQKWIGQIQTSIESKISINKLNSLIQQAKQNKFDVPQTIKDQIDKSIKLGRQLKKILTQPKISMDRLIAKKQLLVDQKIITNQMISFEDTLQRCEEWIIKANKFESQYFENPIGTMNLQTVQKVLKKLPNKIQYRIISMLVQEYNNLPVQLISFQINTKKLYEETNLLLDRLPQFIKNNKTRTANPTKVSFNSMKILLRDISLHPVTHQQFDTLQKQIRESLQLIQRISMFLQDQRTQKSIKLMSGYLKLTNDLPIQNNVCQRLSAYLDYYNIIEKIKKDIINPNKFQQTQDLINQATQKGYFSAQLLQYESKLKVYRGWFQSTQILSGEQFEIKMVDLIKNESQLIVNMIQQSIFKSQLQTAKTQLNIQAPCLEQYVKKFSQIEERKQNIRSLLSKQDPDLKQLIHELFSCIHHSIKYPEFISLYIRVKNFFTIIVKIEFLLQHYKFEENSSNNYFFKKQEYQQILSIVSSKKQIKQMSKEDGEKLLNETMKKNFPKSLPQIKLFRKFIQQTRNWETQALQFISNYQKTYEVNSAKLEKLMQESSDVLTNERIISQLIDIQQIIKWKNTLESKIQQKPLNIFQDQQIKIIKQINQSISMFQTVSNQETLKHQALKYLSDNQKILNHLINIIIKVSIQKTQKLTQLIKLYKQVERLNLKDINLDHLKDKLYTQILNCQSWKQRYTAIRKIDLRRIKKDQEAKDTIQKEDVDKQEKMDIQNTNLIQEVSVETEQRQKSIRQYKKKQKFLLKYPQFSYYFKLPLLLIQFYNGTKLKIYLEELNKIKNLLNQVNEFNLQAQKLKKKQKPTAPQIQSLQIQSSKLNVFFLQSWKLKKKNEYIQSWIKMTSSILQSVPILKMQQLQRKINAQLNNQQVPAQINDNNNLAKKIETINNQENQKEIPLIEKQVIALPQENIIKDQQQQIIPEKKQKRERKVNTYYCNDQITLLTEQLYNNKTKKKKKIEEVTGGFNSPQRKKNQSKKSNKNQQMLRQVEQYLQDPTVYCICRLGLLNQVSYMIQCEYCENWFHTECIGIRKSYVKNVDKYYCVACSKRYQIKEDYMQNFYWEYHKKISFNQFNILLEQGRQIGVVIDEQEKMETINNKIQIWRKQISKIFDIINLNVKPDTLISKQVYDQLFQLYLQSFWFPTNHVETEAMQLFMNKYWKQIK